MDEEKNQGMDQGMDPEMNKEEAPVETPTPTEAFSAGDEDEKSMGPVIGAIIIIVVLVIGGIYFLGNRSVDNGMEGTDHSNVEMDNGMPDGTMMEGDMKDTATEALETQSSSDELEAIEADLEATDLGDLDAELKNIDAELGGL